MGDAATNRRFDGQVALVTGSSAGIGEGIACRLAAEGARVVVNARAQDRAEAVAAAIRERGHDAVAIAGDVADPDQAEELFARIAADCGALDILVNNAGTTFISPSEDLPRGDWQRLVDLNLTAVFDCSQRAARVMLPRGRGVIVNVSSVAGVLGLPQRAAYVATKHAVIGLTRVLGVEWAERGVRVMAVAPAYVETPMVRAASERGGFSMADIERRTPMGRLGTADEVAGVVAFLASGDAAYLSGSCVFVDGGWTAFGGF